MRKLATIRTVSKLSPIPGADRIELAQVDGWECVVKKGELQEGGPCIYFEIDSVLPRDKEWSQFMKDRKYRVKTAKFLKQLSQGLALPVSILPPYLPQGTALEEGFDVTDLLGVVKYDPEASQESKEALDRRTSEGIKGFLARFKKKNSTRWPRFLTKTDEERVQNIQNLGGFLRNTKALYSTEKLHGQSATYYLRKKEGLLCRVLEFFGRVDQCWEFGVCSRNYKIPVGKKCSWWDVESKYNIEGALRSYCTVYDCELAIQGEIIGPRICENDYRRSSYEFYVFTITDLRSGARLSLEEKQAVCSYLSLAMAPLRRMVFTEDLLKEEDPRKYLIGLADGTSTVCITYPIVPREGLVFRDLLNDSLSFKVISNEWLECH